jgi:tetratricopeptide (TPR) repeat protein
VILGNLNFRQNFALAERYFLRAAALSPADAYAWNGMGAMYAEKGDYRKAVTAFETALKENPRFANAHLGLAVALADSGEPRRAFEALERGSRNDNHTSGVTTITHPWSGEACGLT